MSSFGKQRAKQRDTFFQSADPELLAAVLARFPGIRTSMSSSSVCGNGKEKHLQKDRSDNLQLTTIAFLTRRWRKNCLTDGHL